MHIQLWIALVAVSCLCEVGVSYRDLLRLFGHVGNFGNSVDQIVLFLLVFAARGSHQGVVVRNLAHFLFLVLPVRSYGLTWCLGVIEWDLHIYFGHNIGFCALFPFS